MFGGPAPSDTRTLTPLRLGGISFLRAEQFSVELGQHYKMMRSNIGTG